MGVTPCASRFYYWAMTHILSIFSFQSKVSWIWVETWDGIDRRLILHTSVQFQTLSCLHIHRPMRPVTRYLCSRDVKANKFQFDFYSSLLNCHSSIVWHTRTFGNGFKFHFKLHRRPDRKVTRLHLNIPNSDWEYKSHRIVHCRSKIFPQWHPY